MTIERSLVLVKPDGFQRGLSGEVLRRIEAKGYVLTALSVLTPTAEMLAEHYAEHEGKPFYQPLVEFMSSGPVTAAVIEGQDCVKGFRSLAGATNPTDAAPGTIRGDFGRDWGTKVQQNIVHGSDSPESAAREIAIWFPALSADTLGDTPSVGAQVHDLGRRRGAQSRYEHRCQDCALWGGTWRSTSAPRTP